MTIGRTVHYNPGGHHQHFRSADGGIPDQISQSNPASLLVDVAQRAYRLTSTVREIKEYSSAVARCVSHAQAAA